MFYYLDFVSFCISVGSLDYIDLLNLGYADDIIEFVDDDDF